MYVTLFFIFSRDYRSRGGNNFNGRGGRGNFGGGRGGGGNGGFGGLKGKQPGQNLRKAEYDMQDMDPIAKNYYCEHPNVSRLNEVRNFPLLNYDFQSFQK